MHRMSDINLLSGGYRKDILLELDTDPKFMEIVKELSELFPSLRCTLQTVLREFNRPYQADTVEEIKPLVEKWVNWSEEFRHLWEATPLLCYKKEEGRFYVGFRLWDVVTINCSFEAMLEKYTKTTKNLEFINK